MSFFVVAVAVVAVVVVTSIFAFAKFVNENTVKPNFILSTTFLRKKINIFETFLSQMQ